MRIVQILISIAIFCVAGFAQNYPCLPPDVTVDTVVSIRTITLRSGGTRVDRTTVGQTLRNLKARCSKGKLRDNYGREVRFFHLDGCWGNPPADYLEIMTRQRKEIARLKRSYTVIELTCYRGDAPPQSVSQAFDRPM